MAITIGCKGIFTPGNGEDRDILYLDVEYNGNRYDWQMYIPVGQNIDEFVASNTARIQAQIEYTDSNMLDVNIARRMPPLNPRHQSTARQLPIRTGINTPTRLIPRLNVASRTCRSSINN